MGIILIGFFMAPKTRKLRKNQLIQELLDPTNLNLQTGQAYGTGVKPQVDRISSNSMPDDVYAATATYPHGLDPSRQAYPTALGEDEKPIEPEMNVEPPKDGAMPLSATFGAPIRQIFSMLNALSPLKRAAVAKLLGQAILAIGDPDVNVAEPEEDKEEVPD